MKNPSGVVVAILTFRRESELAVCIDSVRASIQASGASAQVVVGDNDPESTTRRMLPTGSNDCISDSAGYLRRDVRSSISPVHEIVVTSSSSTTTSTSMSTGCRISSPAQQISTQVLWPVL